MLINLLARAEGIIDTVQLDCPPSVPLANNVVPFGTAQSLRERLVEAGSLMGIRPVVLAPAHGRADRTLVVAPTTPPTTAAPTMTIWASGWWGGVSTSADGPPTAWTLAAEDNPLPFGPYLAAALAAADVFLTLRLPPGARTTPPTYGWDAWSQRPAELPPTAGPTALSLDLTRAGLAGAGAVGAA